MRNISGNHDNNDVNNCKAIYHAHDQLLTVLWRSAPFHEAGQVELQAALNEKFVSFIEVMAIAGGP
jgi:hypothetical protein